VRMQRDEELIRAMEVEVEAFLSAVEARLCQLAEIV
jgi:hypothetical protein